MASGAALLTTSYGSPDRESILPSVTAWAQGAYGGTSVVFAAMVARIYVFCQAELKLQAKDDLHLFTDQSLQRLQEPWPDAGTTELLARMELDAGIAGNSYTWEPPGEDRLVRLRPDWTTIVSEVVPVGGDGWYRRKTGYWHEPPKGTAGAPGAGFFVPAEEVAHWAPQPEPAHQVLPETVPGDGGRDPGADDRPLRDPAERLQDPCPRPGRRRHRDRQQPGADGFQQRDAGRFGPDPRRVLRPRCSRRPRAAARRRPGLPGERAEVREHVGQAELAAGVPGAFQVRARPARR